MSDSYQGTQAHHEDVKQLHSMGYAQELARRMGTFQNFAISFSIICILAGGITSFQAGFSGAGGAAIGIGWPVGCLFSLIVAAAMGQIASAYPTAGGLYHWASILGGKGWGWATAWFNMLGLVFVVASVDVGVWILFVNLIGVNYLGLDASVLIPDASKPFSEQLASTGYWVQFVAMVVILITQGLFNHLGIRMTTILTDFSGYLIFVVAIVLTIALLIAAPSIDISRLFTFTNNTGDPGGSVWPATDSMLVAFLLGLLLPCYTVTGFDASAHTSEETRNAAVTAPKGMIHSVLWSFIFGYVMVCSFVLAMPDTTEAAKQGFNVFYWTVGGAAIPGFLKFLLYVGIVLANYLCALSGLTSFSRMLFAFARDGGLPGSRVIKYVSPTYRTPVYAIWVGAILSLAASLYTPAFLTLAAGCAVFLYISYNMAILAGMFAEGRSWTKKGPFSLGVWSKPIGALSVLGTVVLTFIGIHPPNDALIQYGIGLLIILIVVWWLFERRRFQGPPIGDMIAKKQAELLAAEKAVGEAAE